MLTIKVSEAEGRLKLTTKKEEESEGGGVYIHMVLPYSLYLVFCQKNFLDLILCVYSYKVFGLLYFFRGGAWF
jgi:hypothetical protein